MRAAEEVGPGEEGEDEDDGGPEEDGLEEQGEGQRHGQLGARTPCVEGDAVEAGVEAGGGEQQVRIVAKRGVLVVAVVDAAAPEPAGREEVSVGVIFYSTRFVATSQPVDVPSLMRTAEVTRVW